jgi:hypothetical protein
MVILPFVFIQKAMEFKTWFYWVGVVPKDNCNGFTKIEKLYLFRKLYK